MSTEHFADWELACRCGCGRLPTSEFQAELEALRVDYGRPMRLSSGMRDPTYNDLVSSTGRGGPHTIGAFDSLCFGEDAWELVRILTKRNWSGIGIAQKGPRETRFIHGDYLIDGPGSPRPWIWSY